MKIIVVSAIFLIFFSCNRHNSNEQPNDENHVNIYTESNIKKIKTAESIGYTEISQKSMRVTASNGLRIRSEPSLEGDILGILSYGEEIIVNKKSVNIETIGGNKDYWYGIRNRNGWVFGGFLSEVFRSETEISFSFTAKGISEGIILHFYNIPENTNSLSVILTDITENRGIIRQVTFEKNIWEKDRLNDLAEVKQSGSLLCPFAIEGHKYNVTVSLLDFEILLAKYSVNVVAGGGIFVENNPSLFFVNNNRYLTLSERPIFSEEIEFFHDSFGFHLRVMLEDINFGSVSVSRSELTSPIYELIDFLQRPFGSLGTIPITGFVRTSVIHGNAVWGIDIAVTEEIVIAF